MQCLFCKMTVESSPLGPVSSLTMDSWPDLQCQAYVPSCGTELVSNHNVVGYPHIIITSMGIFCNVGDCCSSKGSFLGKTLMTLLFL